MKKSIKILICVIMIIFGVIGADCLYGLTIGGYFGWIAAVICLAVGLILAAISVIIIFDKAELGESKTTEAFIIIMIVFMIACLFTYNPLNKISGTNDYVESQVEVVEIWGRGKGSIPFVESEYDVTVIDENGNQFVVGDYNISIDYEEGDTITLREFTGGFGIKYHQIQPVE